MDEAEDQPERIEGEWPNPHELAIAREEAEARQFATSELYRTVATFVASAHAAAIARQFEMTSEELCKIMTHDVMNIFSTLVRHYLRGEMKR